jgi:hypothetical protein
VGGAPAAGLKTVAVRMCRDGVRDHGRGAPRRTGVVLPDGLFGFVFQNLPPIAYHPCPGRTMFFGVEGIALS